MNCPYCGAEVSPTEQVCSFCGGAIQAQPAQQTPTMTSFQDDPGMPSYPQAPNPPEQAYAEASQYQMPAYQQPAYSGPKVSSVKEFVNQLCSDKTRKSLRSCWIILYICAGITFLLQIITGTIPIDGIVLAAIAVWLQLTCSKAAAIVAVCYAALSVILTLVTTGRMSGWLIIIASVLALIYTIKISKAYKKYQETGIVEDV